jgi:transketolase
LRDTFISALLEHAKADPRIILITGDLGFGVLDQFRRELPLQFLNAGVAEQNMTGLAAGLALEGRTVFTYSIANFPTLRCLEQIRNDVAYHGANVKIVAIGGGFSYGALGMSHHATEDVAILRALPGIRVYAPCDELETRRLTHTLVTTPGPCYLRLDKSKVAGSENSPFDPASLRCLKSGADVAIVGYGGILGEALASASTLAGHGIDCAVYSAHTLKPFDAAGLAALVRRVPALITLEEHVGIGGLGSIAAEVLIRHRILLERFLSISLPDSYSSVVGSQEYLRERLEVDARSVTRQVLKMLERQA